MNERHYCLRIQTGATEDLDDAMKAAVGWLGDSIDPTGEHRLDIEVRDPASRTLLFSYHYDPKEK